MRSSEARGRAPRRRVLHALLAGLLLATSFGPGCVSRQRREMMEAREAYQQCVAQNPESHETKCAARAAEAIARQDRYEDDARRAWGCDGTSGPGCDPRDREPRLP